MQTNKARNVSSEVHHKTSPITPKLSHTSKASGSESDSTNSKLTLKKASAERSPKTSERRSPRSPVNERKRPNRLSELESQVSHLQEDLKKTKDQLCSSESSKKRLQLEADEAKKQLSAMLAKLEESQQQLVEFSEAENIRIRELRKISQERDKAWQSELEALQNQHSIDSATLGSAMNEIQRLKQSEAAQAKDSEITQSELDALKEDFAATLSTVEKLEFQIEESGKAEKEAKLMAFETQKQLEVTHSTIESLRTEVSNLLESLNSTISKLEESRVRVSALEEMVKELQEPVEDDEVGREVLEESGDLESKNMKTKERELELTLYKISAELSESKALLMNKETEVQSLAEVNKQLKEEIEKHKAKQIDSELETQRSENMNIKQYELELTLQKLSVELSDSRALMINKETELKNLSETNKQLKEEIEKCKANEFDSGMELMKATTFITELKAYLLDKETELQNLLEENEQLTSKHSMKEFEHQKMYSEAVAEAEKNSKKVVNFAEQLEAAKAMNSEMEAELRRLRVQSDQWRKAAEAAAAVLTPGSNHRVGDRTGSLDSDFDSISGKLMSSPFSDEDDESLKKKNSNVLRKIGGLWKKGPK